jgi:cobalt transporter subunit CbtB
MTAGDVCTRRSPVSFLPRSGSHAPLEDLMSASILPETRAASSISDRDLLGTLSLILGLGFVFLVGFAPLSAVHNAAHDTRHTAAFPCH